VEALEPRFLLDGSQVQFGVGYGFLGPTGLADPAPLLVNTSIAAVSLSDTSASPPPAAPPSAATSASWADGVSLPDTPWVQITSPPTPPVQVSTTPTTVDTGSDAPDGFGLESGPDPAPTPPDSSTGIVIGPAPVTGPGAGDGPSKVWYQIPVDSDTVSVKLQLSPQSPDVPLNEEMMVFDPMGRKLGDLAPGSKGGGLSVSVPTYLRAFRTRGWLHLEIAAIPPADASSSSQTTSPSAMSPFILVITREYATTLPSGFSSTGVVRVIPLPSDVSSTDLADGGSRATSNSAPGLGGSSAVTLTSAPVGQGVIPTPAATGPLPSRSAAPLGGVLDDGDPVPAIDRLAAVRVDFDLIDPGGPGCPVVHEAVPIVDEPQGVPAGPVVAIRGPGGFPLLASGLGVDRPIAPMASVAALVPWATQPASEDVPSPASEEPEAPGRSRPGRRATAMSGLSVAMALGFGLVLPDLVSTFQEREPRRFRLRLRRKPRRDAI
jgi:hypothetical protein